MELVLAFNAAVYALHTYLDFRQLRVGGACSCISQMPDFICKATCVQLATSTVCLMASTLPKSLQLLCAASRRAPTCPSLMTPCCTMQAIRLPHPPKELRTVSDPVEFRKTQAYQTEKWWFGLVQGCVLGVCTRCPLHSCRAMRICCSLR